MAKNDGGPAYPTGGTFFKGMTLRDWFAGQALAGLTACGHYIEEPIHDAAADAYRYADAMLAERGK